MNQEVTIIVKPFRQEKVFHYGVNSRREFGGSGVRGPPSYAAIQTKEHVAAVDARAVGIVAAGKAEEGLHCMAAWSPPPICVSLCALEHR